MLAVISHDKASFRFETDEGWWTSDPWIAYRWLEDHKKVFNNNKGNKISQQSLLSNFIAWAVRIRSKTDWRTTA